MSKDYCTWFPDGDWSTCCARHDRRYANKRLNRYQADVLLRRCIERKGYYILSKIMFIGVRMFGWYFYNRINNV